MDEKARFEGSRGQGERVKKLLKQEGSREMTKVNELKRLGKRRKMKESC
jgi:hypothetical protein